MIMESGRAKRIFMVCSVLSLLAGKSTADFSSCYDLCFLSCSPTVMFGGFEWCVASCTQTCLSTARPLDNNDHKDNRQLFCKLACATSSCTKRNLGRKEVGSCVDSCSQTCTKAYPIKN